MEKYKIHVSSDGKVKGYGPNVEEYQPCLADGDTIRYSDVTPAPPIEGQLAAIEAEYAPKIAALQTALVAATLTGGAIMDGNIASLRTEWVALLNAKSAAIEALLI